MKTVTAVKMRYNPRTFWFDPKEAQYAQGDYVLVETERGREVGLVVDGSLEVSEAQVKKLKTPLKPVLRKLGDEDMERVDELDAQGREAMPFFREMIVKHGLDIKAVEVEYLFSGDKAVFYFASDVRVDFRELVRELSAHFHIRVDMRQIGARDEARLIGGLAHCGEEMCCSRLGGEFQPVSIRMAKEQDLPLNPAKISGACGRLMCCLRYEFDAYREFKQRAPRKGAIIETPLGKAKVMDYDTPREIINLRLEDGKALAIPLARMDCERDEKGACCNCCVSRETIDACASPSILLALSALDRESERLEDALLTNTPADQSRMRPRRRRDGKDGAAGSAGSASGRGSDGGKGGKAGRERQRPGSGSGSGPGAGRAPGGTDADGQEQARSGAKRRRRSSGGSRELGGAPSAGAGQQLGAQQPQQAQQSQQVDAPQRTPRREHAAQPSQGKAAGAKPRPGQRSSGLRNPQRKQRPHTRDAVGRGDQGAQGAKKPAADARAGSGSGSGISGGGKAANTASPANAPRQGRNTQPGGDGSSTQTGNAPSSGAHRRRRRRSGGEG